MARVSHQKWKLSSSFSINLCLEEISWNPQIIPNPDINLDMDHLPNYYPPFYEFFFPVISAYNLYVLIM